MWGELIKREKVIRKYENTQVDDVGCCHGGCEGPSHPGNYLDILEIVSHLMWGKLSKREKITLKSRFGVRVSDTSVWRGVFFATTHNGWQWNSLRIMNPEHEIPLMLEALAGLLVKCRAGKRPKKIIKRQKKIVKKSKV